MAQVVRVSTLVYVVGKIIIIIIIVKLNQCSLKPCFSKLIYLKPLTDRKLYVNQWTRTGQLYVQTEEIWYAFSRESLGVRVGASREQ